MKFKLFNGKQGASFSGWLEVIVLSVAIVVLFSSIFSGMNTLHSKDYNLGLGTKSTVDALEKMQSQVQEKIQGGQVSFLGYLGMSLTTAWDMTLGLVSLIWNFITGGWLEIILIDYLYLPAEVTMLIRLLWFISLVFVIYKIIFRVNT